jgi:hypothetical protein
LRKERDKQDEIEKLNVAEDDDELGLKLVKKEYSTSVVPIKTGSATPSSCICFRGFFLKSFPSIEGWNGIRPLWAQARYALWMSLSTIFCSAKRSPVGRERR